MLYWQDMKNFVEQIPIKFEGFFVIKRNLVQNAIDKYTKISVKLSMEIRILADIQNVKYRPIISVDRYVGQSLGSKTFVREKILNTDIFL